MQTKIHKIEHNFVEESMRNIPAQDLIVWILRSKTSTLNKWVISPANLNIFIFPPLFTFSPKFVYTCLDQMDRSIAEPINSRNEICPDALLSLFFYKRISLILDPNNSSYLYPLIPFNLCVNLESGNERVNGRSLFVDNDPRLL